jgi:integrase
MSGRGRVYRRCACRGENGHQLGTACPRLAENSKHGTWYFAVDVPTVDGQRKTMRRGGHSTKRAAQAALDDVLDRTRQKVRLDDRETLAAYLAGWLDEKALVRKAKTMDGYRRYVDQDIVPALGAVRLEQLDHDHIRRFGNDLTKAGRGAVTVRRILAVLSSALTDAVKRHRLPHNVAEHVVRPPVETFERVPWTASQLAAFLDHAQRDRLGPLFEVIAGCGLRRGEALALRWRDVDLDSRGLYVRRTLSVVGGRLVFSEPKTATSTGWVGLSMRVVEALKMQRARQAVERAEWGAAYESGDLVFAKENGAPLRPEIVLRRFRALTASTRLGLFSRTHPSLTDAEAREKLAEGAEDPLPAIRIHDLRHGAATLLLGSVLKAT